MNEPIKQSRRWFQFSLRTLLVLMLVVAAYFAGFSTARKLDDKTMREAQEKAAAELEVARQAAVDSARIAEGERAAAELRELMRQHSNAFTK